MESVDNHIKEQTGILEAILKPGVSRSASSEAGIFKSVMVSVYDQIEEQTKILTSTYDQIKEQTGILETMLNLQISEAEKAELRSKLVGADRSGSEGQPSSTPPAEPTPAPTPQTQSNNTLAGLLGGLTALFGRNMLGRFAVLAAGAAALALSVATTIGLIRGQLTAIKTYFKAFAPGLIKIFKAFAPDLIKIFKAFAPGLIKIFDDFKISVSSRISSIAAGFKSIVDDFKARAGLIRVAVNDAFDNFIKSIKGLFSSGAGTSSKFSVVISAIGKAVDTLIEPFRTALTTLKELAGPRGGPGKIAGIFKSITGWFGSLGAQIGKIAGVVGKLFAPIAIIMTAFETIKGAIDGYAEGGILGAFEGALSGFFTSLIAAPLDLLKNVVSWVAGVFGFDKVSEVLDSFSFTDLFKQVIGSLFNGVSSALSVITDLFTFTDEDKTFFGTLGKLTDIVFLPVNMAINFVKGIFGFDDSEGPPFKLQDWLMEKVYSIIDWLGSLFSWDEDEADRGLTPRDRNPAPNRASVFQEDYSFASGTRGFVNFGQGTRATLHGLEAVVPRNTDAGKILANNFDDNWGLKLSTIENSGMSSSKPIIINAPNNSQTNVSSRGGTASTIINSFGASRSDLDALSRPAGAN
jgi:hypothetical protein